MRCLVHLLLLVAIVSARTYGKPQPMQNVGDSDTDEAEYENDEDDPSEEPEDASTGQESSGEDPDYEIPQRTDGINFGRHLHEKLAPSAELDADQTTNHDLSDYKPSKNSDGENHLAERATEKVMIKNFFGQSQIHRFFHPKQLLFHAHDNKYLINKQTPNSNKEGDLRFEYKEDPDSKTRPERNNRGKRLDYSYFRRFPNGTRKGIFNKDDVNLEVGRERRGVLDNESIPTFTVDDKLVAYTDVNVSDTKLAEAYEAEATIKRQVKKLSPDELHELLYSLSEDKRQLLKKIIENNTEYNNDQNKREITKKAGAAPDNSYSGSRESGASNFQYDSIEPEIILSLNSNFDPVKKNKQFNHSANERHELNNLTFITKSADSGSENLALFDDKKVHISKLTETKSQSDTKQSSKTNSDIRPQSQPDTSEPLPKDSHNAEEDDSLLVKLNTEDVQETPVDLTLFGDGEEKYAVSDTSDSFDSPAYDDFDEASSGFVNKNGNNLKREVKKEGDMLNLVGSLEDSFPSSNYHSDKDPYSGSNLAPLVRVKRRNVNSVMEKREANILPESNVVFLPYRAENDDEDNDEGNEFDDNGFYDPTSNLAKRYLFNNVTTKESKNNTKSTHLKLFDVNEDNHTNVGPANDSVLSGVVGIDENFPN